MPWHYPEIGWPRLEIHPIHLLTAEDLVMLQLWQARRGPGPMMIALAGMGAIHAPSPQGPLPFAGGVADQPAWVMEAFQVMDGAAAALKRRLPEGGQ